MTEEKIVTIKMPYGDLNDTICVFEDWLNDRNNCDEQTRANVARIYFRLMNIWGDNASNGKEKRG